MAGAVLHPGQCRQHFCAIGRVCQQKWRIPSQCNIQYRTHSASRECLNKGVPLYFVVEFELIYPRWYTLFFLNKRIAGFEQIYRLSYNALTRQYRLSYGVLQQSFDTLEDALAVLGGIKDQRVLTDSRLDEDRLYEAQVRMRLDSSRLPKPFQVYAFGSIAWDVSSSWFRWTVRP